MMAARAKKPSTGSDADKKTAASARLHPKLWDEIKEQYHRGAKGGPAGKWNARKAQLAVLEYKRRSREKYGDSGYRTAKPGKGNTLVKWTAEDWGYAGKDGNSRYLPKKVRDSLTPAERRRENAAKKGKKGTKVPYSGSVKEKMRAAGVF